MFDMLWPQYKSILNELPTPVGGFTAFCRGEGVFIYIFILFTSIAAHSENSFLKCSRGEHVKLF